MFFTLVFLGFVIAIVSTEVHALIAAFAFSMKYPKKQFRWQLFRLRYFFNSVVFHEIFAYKRRVKPAYKLSGFLVLHCITFFAAVLHFDVHTNAEVFELLGVGCAVGGVFFVATYGRAFLAHRDLVARLMLQGNPAVFTDLS